MQDAESEFRNYLEERGYRTTPERFAVLREVIRSEGHFEADDIFVRLRSKSVSASQTSVYRTLNLLVEAGIVRKNPCDRMSARYEAVFGSEHHDHLICLRCGRIIEFQDENLQRILKEVADRRRFELVGHRLVLSGYCEDCR